MNMLVPVLMILAVYSFKGILFENETRQLLIRPAIIDCNLNINIIIEVFFYV
jgi:hypothetical protein